nr:immunoglobulin heavy chain junction region [Mus musculus]
CARSNWDAWFAYW